MASFKIEECLDLKHWDNFVEQSPQGTIFSNSLFISSLSYECSYYFITKGEEIVAATYVLEEEKYVAANSIPFLQYNNCIMFKGNGELLHHKRIDLEFKITELIINEILSLYDKYEVIHTPAFHDLRPFLWHNYHTPEKGIFNNEIYYAPIINLDRLSTSELLRNIRGSRRREIMNCTCSIEESDDIDKLDELHNMTFNRQGIERSNEESRLLKKITESAIKNSYGRLAFGYVDGEAISSILFLNDTRCGYYLFGATNPNFRKTGVGSKLLFNNIAFFKNSGLSKIDLVGANSPQRGSYKISFNADVYPYFSCKYNKTN